MKHLDKSILLALPVISVSAEILKSFFEQSQVMAVRNYLCLLLVLVLCIRHFTGIVRFNLSLVALSVFLLVMLPIQQAGLNSYHDWITVFQSKLMLPLAFVILRQETDLKKLTRMILVIGALFACFILVFLFFHIGENQYGGHDGFTAGSFKFSRIYTGSFVLLALPLAWLMTSGYRNRAGLAVVAVVIIFILILSTRRTSWLIVLTGVAVFAAYFIHHLPKMMMAAVGLLLGLLASYPMYEETLKAQLQKRQHVFVQQQGFELESETRFEETLAVWNERIHQSDLTLAWFGDHLFDSPGHYDQGIHGERPLHLDINIILHGAGLLGLLLFILFHAELLVTFFRLRPRPVSTMHRMIEATCVATMLSMVMLIFSGGMAAVTHNMIASLLIGTCLAAMAKTRHAQELRNTDAVPKPRLFIRQTTAPLSCLYES